MLGASHTQSIMMRISICSISVCCAAVQLSSRGRRIVGSPSCSRPRRYSHGCVTMSSILTVDMAKRYGHGADVARMIPGIPTAGIYCALCIGHLLNLKVNALYSLPNEAPWPNTAVR
jgi:hypothetical protein